MLDTHTYAHPPSDDLARERLSSCADSWTGSREQAPATTLSPAGCRPTMACVLCIDKSIDYIPLPLSLSLAVSPVSPGLLPPGIIHLHLAAPALRSLSSLRLCFLLLLPIRGEPERPPLKSQSFTGGTLLRSSVHLINGQLYGVPLPENSGKLYKGFRRFLKDP